MRISKLLVLMGLLPLASYAQNTIHGDREQKWEENYRASSEKVFELIHTKLKVDFDLQNSTMNGEEWLALKPYFYAQETLVLDAKGMEIYTIKNGNEALKFSYDNEKINIDLSKEYTAKDTLNLYIKYKAQPEKVTQKGSKAITDAKGLYFIDPKDENPEKPTQIWTQGETESSSCWFPTIDSPNQKTTQEIYITVEDRFKTLSNGDLKSSIKNSNNTRTDYWKMDQKHAPYLFFMGIGEYEVIQDQWKGKKVDYYVEKKYAPYAQQTYGMTPEMMTFFSDFTEVEYPWSKYSQMVGRDYVSGAMENTTAVIHGEGVNQTAKQLNDENTWEDTIAHELFHHWFGDYVTCESWSNLTVNESFANYSEYLWREYKYGQDHADAHRYDDLQGYLADKTNFQKKLVRFKYASKEDMFDAVSYNKGGAILHMLRNYLGKEAFRKGISNYLKTNKYQSAEAHQLRIALEKVSGKDLNWFFDQWYFGSGHPGLSIKYNRISDRKVEVKIIQTQSDKTFKLPMIIDAYSEGKKKSTSFFMDEKQETIVLETSGKLDFINVDADKVLIANITDYKNKEQWLMQLQQAPKYLDKLYAIQGLENFKTDKDVLKIYKSFLENKAYYELKIILLNQIDFNDKNSKKLLPIVEKIANNAKSNLLKAEAIRILAQTKNARYKSIYTKGLQEESYAINASSLKGLYSLNPSEALVKSKELLSDASGDLAQEIATVLIKEKDESSLEFLAKNTASYFLGEGENREILEKGFSMVVNSNSLEANQIQVNELVSLGKKYASYGVDKMMIQLLDSIKVKKKYKKDSTNSLAQIKAIEKGIESLK